FNTIIVDKESRSTGVGTKLIEEAEELVKKLGAHKAYFNTGKTWRTVKLYKSLGYKVTGEYKNHYFNQDFLIFTKFF
ncbi:GNAT family N-acetyltransferase, partial [Patescibacteria group bacterium]|nr:GNAT family N-acetyltransferase [Patescibacteria group bacterium]